MKSLKTCLCTALLASCMVLPFAGDAMARVWIGATVGVPVGTPAYYPYPAYYGAYPYYVPPPPGYVYAAPPPPYAAVPAPVYTQPAPAYAAPAPVVR